MLSFLFFFPVHLEKGLFTLLAKLITRSDGSWLNEKERKKKGIKSPTLFDSQIWRNQINAKIKYSRHRQS